MTLRSRSSRRRALAALPLLLLPVVADAALRHIDGPAFSRRFGAAVKALPNGNFVVVDPEGGAIEGAGAVHLYAPDGTRISTLTGSGNGNFIGYGADPIQVLPGGNFLVLSPMWDNGTTSDAGAITWVNGRTGLDGVVSPANSLVGTTSGDLGSIISLVVLANGDYAINARDWDRPGTDGSAPIENAGAVIVGSGTAGVSGAIGTHNAMVGASTADGEFQSVFALPQGGFVVVRNGADFDGVSNAGSVTWRAGRAQATGEYAPANSLFGSQPHDRVGLGFSVLSDGSYVVGSPLWDLGGVADAGAATWCPRDRACAGAVAASNSLVGGSAGDQVGLKLVAVPGARYLVLSPNWRGAAVRVGAVTVLSAGAPFAAAVSANNSLTGAMADDRVGAGGAVLLSNGKVVIRSPAWSSGAAPLQGAVTWIDPVAGLTGAVSAANSLIGFSANDGLGNGTVLALSNGHYAVACPSCDINNRANAGAVTWGNGSTGTRGIVSATNSLVGTSVDDGVGTLLTALDNGNYVVASPMWNRTGFFGANDVGAATWVDGSNGRPMGSAGPGAAVDLTNSLFGATLGDHVGQYGVDALSNGHYVVRSADWDDTTAREDCGAVTWGNGTTGTAGVVSASNSMVGTQYRDRLGKGGFERLPGGGYAFASPEWDAIVPWSPAERRNAGAVAWRRGEGLATGPLTRANAFTGENSEFIHLGNLELVDTDVLVIAVPEWRLPTGETAGAIALAFGADGITGTLQQSDSYFGSINDVGFPLRYAWNRADRSLLIGRPGSNRVSLLDARLFGDGFE